MEFSQRHRADREFAVGRSYLCGYDDALCRGRPSRCCPRVSKIVSQLFTVGGGGGILSAGEKFNYISPLTRCSGRRRYKPRSGTTGD